MLQRLPGGEAWWAEDKQRVARKALQGHTPVDQDGKRRLDFYLFYSYASVAAKVIDWQNWPQKAPLCKFVAYPSY